MFGAWGEAPESTGGGLLQLRALDYTTADFLSQHHALVFYHPHAGSAFVSVGWVGTITAVTGVSETKVALSEIGVSNPDASFGPQKSGRGIPFNMLMRDILQF
eukprot:SAG11_NODE_25186_length_362_cov_1.159696_1_plen_102_part_10